MVIPRNQGLFYDILSFTISLIGSLFPGWNPHQAPLPPPDNAAAAQPPAVAN